MSKIIGLVLILVGGLLIYQGVERKDSVAGVASEIGSDVANAVDGKGRVPTHYFYMIGGGVIAAFGVGMMVRGGKKS